MMVTLAGSIVTPGVGREYLLCLNVLFQKQCNTRKILIKIILQKRFNLTALAYYLLSVFSLIIIFSSCLFSLMAA